MCNVLLYNVVIKDVFETYEPKINIVAFESILLCPKRKIGYTTGGTHTPQTNVFTRLTVCTAYILQIYWFIDYVYVSMIIEFQGFEWRFKKQQPNSYSWGQ